MSENHEKPNIFNNAIVVLAIIFTVPALLVVGATLITAQYGRVPGGTETACERTFDTVTIQAQKYRYQAGLTPYETQTFFAQSDSGERVQFYRVDIQAPENFDCESGIQQLDENTILVRTQKGIAISHDSGATWNTHSVCNTPRPIEGRCDEDPLNIVDITFENPQQGRLVVQEAVTDQYGVLVNGENGAPQIINEYILVTSDGGVTWNLVND
jgi:hypothetical protein